MKKYLLLLLLFLKITMLMASGDKQASDVVPFDQEFLTNRSNSITHNRLTYVDGPPSVIDVESNQPDMVTARVIHEHNNKTIRLQLWFTGMVSVVRAAALFQIANAQYHNSFGSALKFIAVVHALYGAGLVAETMCRWHGVQDVEPNDLFQRESERISAKNYALTGLGNIISSAEALLFAFAAPDDPLAPFAMIFGAVQFAAGAVSCAYPGYLTLKNSSPCKACFSSAPENSQSITDNERLKVKLERSRRQQFYSNGAFHLARGAIATLSLSHVMPSRQFSNMLIGFGVCEFGLGVYALLCHPITDAHHYLKGTQKAPLTIEEGSRNFNILRALGFIAMAPVNIVYTLGVPDAKTPWIVGASSLAVVVAVMSGWKPVCDYYGFDLSKYQTPRILPSH